MNALDGCAALGITADELDAEWGKCKKVRVFMLNFYNFCNTSSC